MVKKILAGCLAAALFLGLAYYSGFLYSQRRYQKEEDVLLLRLEELKNQLAAATAGEGGEGDESAPEVRQEALAGQESAEAAHEEAAYILRTEDGSVNIYLSDGTTLYDHTTIASEELPEALRAELLEGKALTGEQELYDFLENYSS